MQEPSFSHQIPNFSVNTDRLPAVLAGSLRGFAAPAAGYLKREANRRRAIAKSDRPVALP